MKTFVTISTFFALAAAHGRITTPTARAPGDAFKTACGAQIASNVQSDPDGNQQQLEQMTKSQKDFNAAACNLSLCKGLQFSDNQANVQKFTAGQVVPITVEIKAPHTGDANVSVVNTQTNAVIGQPMIEFPVYASNSAPIPANNTQFSITMPDVASECGTAGNCVVQWWWDSRSADQTYMSCVDFTM